MEWKGVEPFVRCNATLKTVSLEGPHSQPIIPHSSNKKERKGITYTPHHNIWNFHRGPTILKIINPLSFRDRREPPQTDLIEGRRTPSLTIKTKVASDYSRRHPMTYIRCQSHVILGLVFAYQFRRRFGLRPPCHTPRPEL